MTHPRNDEDGYSDLERDLTEIMRRAGATFDSDPQALADAGLRRGRSRLWRHRAGTVTGAVAAVAAIAVIAPQLPGPAGGEAPPVPPAKPETAADMARELADLLPAGWELSGQTGEGPATAGDPWVSLTADDGNGPVDISVSLNRYEEDDWRTLAGCQGTTSCEERELSEDLVLSTISETFDGEEAITRTDGAGESFWRSWEVWLEGPRTWSPESDGMWQVAVSVSTERPEAAEANGRPPLDFDQLTELARAAVWQDVLDVATAEHGPPMDGDWVEDYADVSPEEIGAVFREVAPGQTVVRERDAGTGQASLDIDDGDGPVTLEIAAFDEYDAMPSDDTTAFHSAEEAECEVTALAGGTEVEACAYPPTPGDPLGIWTATVVRPDGSAISIFEQNMTDDQAEPTRQDGPMSLAELAETAAAEAWTDLIAGD